MDILLCCFEVVNIYLLWNSTWFIWIFIVPWRVRADAIIGPCPTPAIFSRCTRPCTFTHFYDCQGGWIGSFEHLVFNWYFHDIRWWRLGQRHQSQTDPQFICFMWVFALWALFYGSLEYSWCLIHYDFYTKWWPLGKPRFISPESNLEAPWSRMDIRGP